MPTAKRIPVPQGGAQEIIKQQKVAQAKGGISPKQEAELAAMRNVAAMHQETGQQVIHHNQDQPPQRISAAVPGALAQGDTAQDLIDAVIAKQESKPIEISPMDFLQEITKPYEFEIAGRRRIKMAPPLAPYFTDLIVYKIMDNRESLNIDLSMTSQLIRVMCYVRSIDGVAQPNIKDWSDVLRVMSELGELGVRACRAVFNYRWPETGETLWSEVKKPV